MIPASVIDFDTRAALPEMLAELQMFIRLSASGLTDDPELAADLKQEAAVKLWQLDPTRFDDDDTDYVCAALYKCMQDAARRERAARGGRRRVDLADVFAANTNRRGRNDTE